jgi:hypothetical protein
VATRRPHAYIRQEQTFDNERWVEGVEIGINPNYPYVNASAYYIDPDKYTYGLADDDKVGGSGFGGNPPPELAARRLGGRRESGLQRRLLGPARNGR